MPIIHVELRDEGVTCWRPVEAEHVAGDAYRITSACPPDEAWSFDAGDVVRCRMMPLSGNGGVVSDVLVAFQEA